MVITALCHRRAAACEGGGGRDPVSSQHARLKTWETESEIERHQNVDRSGLRILTEMI